MSEPEDLPKQPPQPPPGYPPAPGQPPPSPPQPATITTGTPTAPKPLSDAVIHEIWDGLLLPEEHDIKSMAYEIKKWRGDKNPGSL